MFMRAVATAMLTMLIWLVPMWVQIVTAQAEARVARVGVLFPPADNAAFRAYFEGFRRRIAELGYDEGRNLTLLYGFGDGDRTRLEAEAGRLGDLRPDAVVVIAPAAVEAAVKTIKGIPLVAVDHATDPVAAGHVKTLARPGGTLTGIFMDFPELAGKWLDLLKSITPALTRVAVAWDPSTGSAQLNAAREAAARLRLQPLVVEVRNHADFEAAFRSAASRSANGIVMLTSPIFNTGRRRIAELAIAHRMPTILPFPEYAKEGGLLAYGPDLETMYAQAAVVVGKILSGTPVADIPVERPSRFTLTVNTSAAKALGITIPRAVLLRADQVVE